MVNALQAVFSSLLFESARSEDKQGLASSAPFLDDSGKQALGALPLPRRIRKRLFRGRWVVNFGVLFTRFFRDVARSKGYEVLDAQDFASQPEAWRALVWGSLSGRAAAVVCQTSGFSPRVRPLQASWLWSVASVSGGVCLPFISWRKDDAKGYDIGLFGERLKTWSQCWDVPGSSDQGITNTSLEFPALGISDSCLEEEVGRALFGIQSALWKLEDVDAKALPLLFVPDVVLRKVPGILGLIPPLLLTLNLRIQRFV